MINDHVWDCVAMSIMCKVQELGYYLWLGYLYFQALNFALWRKKIIIASYLLSMTSWLLYYTLKMFLMGHAINIENDAFKKLCTWKICICNF
jgi:hypothetical protein